MLSNFIRTFRKLILYYYGIKYILYSMEKLISAGTVVAVVRLGCIIIVNIYKQPTRRCAAVKHSSERSVCVCVCASFIKYNTYVYIYNNAYMYINLINYFAIVSFLMDSELCNNTKRNNYYRIASYFPCVEIILFVVRTII